MMKHIACFIGAKEQQCDTASARAPKRCNSNLEFKSRDGKDRQWEHFEVSWLAVTFLHSNKLFDCRVYRLRNTVICCNTCTFSNWCCQPLINNGRPMCMRQCPTKAYDSFDTPKPSQPHLCSDHTIIVALELLWCKATAIDCLSSCNSFANCTDNANKSGCSAVCLLICCSESKSHLCAA